MATVTAKEESPGLVQLIGALFATAAIAALALGALAATRLGVGSFGMALVASAAAYAMPALLAAALVRLAASSLEPGTLRPLLVALTLVASGTLFVALAIGRALRATTHHTGLGGTTFAVVCTGFALLALPLSLRIARSMRGWSTKAQSALLAASVLGLTLMMGMALLRVHASDLGPVASMAADATLLLVIAVWVSLAQVGKVRLLARVAPPLFVGLLVLGAVLVRSRSDLSAALVERAALAARCSSWMLQ